MIHAFVRGTPPRAMLRVAAQRLAKRAAPQWGAAARPALVPFARAYADDANLLKTALYDFHLEMGEQDGATKAVAPRKRRLPTTCAPRLSSRIFVRDRTVLTASFSIPHGVFPGSPRARKLPFAGHSIPSAQGLVAGRVRKHGSAASIFDVSHMLGSSIRGKDAIAFTERIVVGDIKALKNGSGTLSVVVAERARDHRARVHSTSARPSRATRTCTSS